MKKYYTESIKGVRCIRCRYHFPSVKDLAKHYATGGKCRVALVLERPGEAA